MKSRRPVNSDISLLVSEPGAVATGSGKQLAIWSQYHPRKRMGQRLNLNLTRGYSVAAPRLVDVDIQIELVLIRAFGE